MVTIIDLKSKKWSINRTQLRNEIVTEFLKENAGAGKGILAQRYTYEVDLLTSGNIVFLRRPGLLNNGFDFTVNVENINFNKGSLSKNGKKIARATTRPSHVHILKDLGTKKQESLTEFSKLISEISLVYNCQVPRTTTFNFKKGYPCDLLLACIKWLFIEQDVTYWNYSGRAMFYNEIMNI